MRICSNCSSSFPLRVELNAESVGTVRFIKNRLEISKFYDFNFNWAQPAVSTCGTHNTHTHIQVGVCSKITTRWEEIELQPLQSRNSLQSFASNGTSRLSLCVCVCVCRAPAPREYSLLLVLFPYATLKLFACQECPLRRICVTKPAEADSELHMVWQSFHSCCDSCRRAVSSWFSRRWRAHQLR